MPAINVNRVIVESRFRPFHWLMLVLGVATTTFDGYDLVLYGAAVPLLIKEWSLTPAQAGVIGSYALAGAAIGAPIFGRLADKIGRKRTIVFCVTLFSALTGLAGLAVGARQFALCRFLAGLGIGGCIPNIIALITEYAPARHRALMVSAASAGMQVGGVAAAGASIWLFPIYGWRSVFWVGALPLLIVPALVRYMPESPQFYLARGNTERLKKVLSRVDPSAARDGEQRFTMDPQSRRSPVRALFQEHRGFSTVMVWIVYITNMFMIFGLGIWLPQLMMEAGFPLGSGLWFLLSLNLGAFLGSNLAGLVADRVGSKRTLVILFLLAFVSITSLSLRTNIYALTALVALAGTGFFGGINLAHGYVSAYYPPAMRSTAMGFALGIGRLGAIAGPAVAGALISLHFSLFANFLCLAVPGLIACLSILLVQDRFGYQHGAASEAVGGKPDILGHVRN